MIEIKAELWLGRQLRFAYLLKVGTNLNFSNNDAQISSKSLKLSWCQTCHDEVTKSSIGSNFKYQNLNHENPLIRQTWKLLKYLSLEVFCEELQASHL